MAVLISPDIPFPEMLRQLRTNVGLTQHQAGEAAGLSRGYWGTVENGRRYVQWRTAIRMLEALGYQVNITAGGKPSGTLPL